MKYFVVYHLTTKDINLVFVREDDAVIGDIEVPDGSWGVAEVSSLPVLPAYLNSSGNAVTYPTQPGPDYIWDPLTLTWVTDLYATGEERGRLALRESIFYWHRGFWLEMGGVWKEITCEDRNLGRIRDAAILASVTAPGDPFEAIILINETAVTVTRSEALAVHAALVAHSIAVDEEILRIQTEIFAAYVLADTDLPAAIAAMQAITWTYIPTWPDED